RAGSTWVNRTIAVATFGSAQPRKTGIEFRNRIRGGLLGPRPGREDVGSKGRRAVQAFAPVAGLGFAAARAAPAQLFGGLVKQQGHGLSFGTTIHPVSGGREASEMWGVKSTLSSAVSNTTEDNYQRQRDLNHNQAFA